MRPSRIDPGEYAKLEITDECYYLGEYTARGGYAASETNQQIRNLQKKPSVPPTELRWKQFAINYWGDTVAAVLGLDVVAAEFTLVPAPSSKPPGSPDYDDRTLRVLQRLSAHKAGLDIRPLLYTPVERPSQHAHGRLTVAELQSSMALDYAHLSTPLRSRVLILDDVFTQGGTFKAMKNIISTLPGVASVTGLFLARMIWPQPDYATAFAAASEPEPPR